jgi:hypothetical protein
VTTVWLSDPRHPGLSVGISEGQDIVDAEGKFAWEPLGFSSYAFIPRKCRNGRWRWLCFLEKHEDGTYTKDRRQGWE